MKSSARNRNGEMKLFINVCVPKTDKCNENDVVIEDNNAIPRHLNIVLHSLYTATVVNDVTIECVIRPIKYPLYVIPRYLQMVNTATKNCGYIKERRLYIPCATSCSSTGVVMLTIGGLYSYVLKPCPYTSE